jgi:hypothetical protein
MGLDATIYGADGRPLQHADFPWAKPIFVPAGKEFETTAAARRDLIVVPKAPGVYPVITEFRDWITGEIQDNGNGIAETVINVTA